jgi:transketolase
MTAATDAVPRASAEAAALVRERARAIRARILTTIAPLGEGYISQGLGAAELFAALYFHELRLRPEDPEWPERDRFLLSTAHNSVAMYATLAERGIVSDAELATYGRDGSPFEIISAEQVPGVEATFGSLGQGLSVGVGLALAARRRERAARTYVMLGDAEEQEGQVWEAAMAAASFRLANLCLIVDLNGMQVEGATRDVLDMGEIAAKWRAFGWRTSEVDGNDAAALLAALDDARAHADGPSAIVAHTVPGKGVACLEGQFKHYAKISAAQVEEALADLRRTDS